MIIHGYTENYLHRPDRKSKIEVITVHSLQGNESTLDSIDEWYRKRIRAGYASCSNYAVSFDGKVGQYVPDGKRAATSSSSRNDDRALTVECATLAGQDKPRYKLYDKTREALVDLLEYLCRKYKKTGLTMLTKETRFDAPPEGTFGVTLHRWFADTDCPGNDVLEKLPGIILEVNGRLRPKSVFYRVQTGVFTERGNAEKEKSRVKGAYIEHEDGYYRVYAGAYTYRKNAEKKVSQLKLLGVPAIIREFRR
ncbi:MAG: N-acetylmuramoyl-L-alanine amidase [Clostridia bacterium]|nr:N-acetylmuramoyl-L-alanine amidase [Clostridia bacterium]